MGTEVLDVARLQVLDRRIVAAIEQRAPVIIGATCIRRSSAPIAMRDSVCGPSRAPRHTRWDDRNSCPRANPANLQFPRNFNGNGLRNR